MKKNYRLFLVAILISVFVIFAESAQSDEKEESSAKALVVIYSYTGNTRAVADEIIKRFKTDTVVIRAKKYDSFMGGMKANNDAWTEAIYTDIDPETVDMSQYNLIFLGSPIWWYRPAVPLWAFVDRNDFKGKPVVLFNTFNSKFKAKYIDKFISLL